MVHVASNLWAPAVASWQSIRDFLSLGTITVTTPTNGAEVSSALKLVASIDSRGSKQALSMGYSIDCCATTITMTSFRAMIIAGDGPHVLHVKCWGPKGAIGHETLNTTVVPSKVIAPSNITTVSNLQAWGNWVWNHDPECRSHQLAPAEVSAVVFLVRFSARYTLCCVLPDHLGKRGVELVAQRSDWNVGKGRSGGRYRLNPQSVCGREFRTSVALTWLLFFELTVS